MKLTGRSVQQQPVEIKDYYGLKIGPMWRGLRQESWAFWWLCIYLFFEYVRPQTIYPEIDIIPWGQVSLLLAIVSAFSDKTIRGVNSAAHVLLGLFVLIIILSSIFAFMPSVSWNKIDTVINWVVLYFLIITIVNTEKRFFVFILLFLLVNFKMSQHGALSFAMRGFSFTGWGVSGSPGWFANAGDFATQMTVFVPLAITFIYVFRPYWGKLKRLFFYLLPVTGLVTIVAAGSRGAQLALVATAVWFLVKSRVGIKSLLLILILGGALYSIFPEEMKSRYSTAGEDKTSVARLALWDYGIKITKENPVLGVGYENWGVYCGFYNITGDVAEGVYCLDPHNSYVEAAAELGITGLVFYILIILSIFIINSQTRRHVKPCGNKFFYYMSHGLDCGVIGYIVSSFFLTIVFYPIIWIQLAMTVALQSLARKTVSTRDVDHHRGGGVNMG